MKKLNIEGIREYYSRSLSVLEGKIRPYIRVSSKNPGQDEARQVKAFNDFKTKWPQFEYDKVYLEKSTAKGGHRTKKFKDMINSARANKFDILWIESISRFARSLPEGINKIETILDAGVRVYIEYFGRVLNPGLMEDKMYLYNMLMVAEMQNHMLQVDTVKSTAVKKEKLRDWGEEEGLLNVRINNATMFDMFLDDPFYDAKKSPGKLGVCVTEIPHMKDIFIQFVVLGYSWSYIANYMKKPVNHKCKYGCWNIYFIWIKTMTKKLEDGKYIEMTAEEIADLENLKNFHNSNVDILMAEFRSKRDNLLAKTDWTANSDVTMSSDMVTYR